MSKPLPYAVMSSEVIGVLSSPKAGLLDLVLLETKFTGGIRGMSQTNEDSVPHSSQVLYEVSDKIGTITLNRPEKLNAMSRSLLNELEATFEEAKIDPNVKVVLLKGSGRSFCAGYDLSLIHI